MKNGAETALADAIFTLSKDSKGTNPIKFVEDITTGDIYRVAKTGETGEPTVTTPTSGRFTIKGLDAGTYYLTETQQPAGYNKLKDPVKVVIKEDGTITVGENTTTPVNEVKVENNTGSILPSTGGSGTTLIYILGAVLVLGSSVVLITKKRMR
ncbi:MAG: SpaA isopeptide-forming pilin-related protein [Eubacteriales bacterium]|nr:SpaA isopeptide-forming pilin-related protein [Eubacteriales bacterium]